MKSIISRNTSVKETRNTPLDCRKLTPYIETTWHTIVNNYFSELSELLAIRAEIIPWPLDTES